MQKSDAVVSLLGLALSAVWACSAAGESNTEVLPSGGQGGGAAYAKRAALDVTGGSGTGPEIRRLGFILGKTDSAALDVSGDGNVVVGISGGTAFRWTFGTSMVTLAGNTLSDSRAPTVSTDGNVVGYEGYDEGTYIARWQGGKATYLEFGGSNLRGGSGDGQLFVGQTSTARGIAWQAKGGSFSVFSSVGDASAAYSASNDGSVVAGVIRLGSNDRAVVWTKSGGNTFLNFTYNQGQARAVNSNGTVVVGWSGVSGVKLAYKWTKMPTGPDYAEFSLGDFAGGGYSNSVALDVSGDGSRIIGWGTDGTGQVPFVWDSAGGLRTVTVELGNRGINWHSQFVSLNGVTAISADGNFIVGSGTNWDGRTEAFRVRLQ